MKVGDRVKMSDWLGAPVMAYRDMCGTVLDVRGAFCKVKWDCDEREEPNYREQSTVVVIDANRCGGRSEV